MTLRGHSEEETSKRLFCVLLSRQQVQDAQALIPLVMRWGPDSLCASQPSRDPTMLAAQM